MAGSANYQVNQATGPTVIFTFLSAFPFAATCTANAGPCLTGSSAEIRTGWTAGGGVEYRIDQRWSAKIEYLFVDLGTETVRITASPPGVGLLPASFNAAFRDQFNVVRLGVNYRFW